MKWFDVYLTDGTGPFSVPVDPMREKYDQLNRVADAFEWCLPKSVTIDRIEDHEE